ncbi:MAG TPA: hypothetical protein DCM39_09085, partial [Pantoea sp.]|nr:hypothetical protein [Pantoea sp.]
AEQLNGVRSCVFRAEFRAGLNSLLTALKPCGMRSLQDIIAWNSAHPQSIPYGQSLLEATDAAPDLRSSAYIDDRRQDIALSLNAGILAALNAGPADVLLSPMSAAAKCTGKAGAPVVAIPAGADSAGLPFGVTVYAAPGQDAAILQAAMVIESVIGQRLMPAITDTESVITTKS